MQFFTGLVKREIIVTKIKYQNNGGGKKTISNRMIQYNQRRGQPLYGERTVTEHPSAFKGTESFGEKQLEMTKSQVL